MPSAPHPQHGPRLAVHSDASVRAPEASNRLLEISDWLDARRTLLSSSPRPLDHLPNCLDFNLQCKLQPSAVRRVNGVASLHAHCKASPIAKRQTKWMVLARSLSVISAWATDSGRKPKPSDPRLSRSRAASPADGETFCTTLAQFTVDITASSSAALTRSAPGSSCR